MTEKEARESERNIRLISQVINEMQLRVDAAEKNGSMQPIEIEKDRAYIVAATVMLKGWTEHHVAGCRVAGIPVAPDLIQNHPDTTRTRQ